ncbi:tRNA pseudouridine(38-40) synthase TruA [Ectothiorhodospiraceae bacterium BW-2]|nr:tRNA pseudouridine(38-40) synthase TruA [Ectothiorhodospiraceae bacterium BW-2]
MRIAVGIEYDGSGFCGWQRQRHTAATIQQVCEEALSQVANQPLALQCAGRTDTGVHAAMQVAHFDTTASRSERSWVLGGNANLPTGVVVHWAKAVESRFHARFSATRRCYRYLIQQRSVRPVLSAHRVCWSRQALDMESMQQAALLLVGRHDFSALRAAGCQARSPYRLVSKFNLEGRGDFIWFDICANAFLHHMVRNIAGLLLAVGRREQPPQWVAEVLQSRDRRLAGVTAPAAGLYLTDISYPAHFGVPTAIMRPDLIG